MKAWLRPIIGAVLVLVGVVWALQGSGAVGKGGMSGHSQWLAIGLVVAIAGAVLLVSGLLKKVRADRR